MSGFDILVVIMGVIAGGVGIFCFVTEQTADKEDKEQEGEKK